MYLLLVTNFILLGSPYFVLVLFKKRYKKERTGQFNIEKPLNFVERFEKDEVGTNVVLVIVFLEEFKVLVVI